MTLGEALEGCQRMGHPQEIGLGIDGVVMLRHLFDDEMTNTTTVEIAHVAMTIVALCLQGKEKRLLRETETTAVCQQPTDIAVAMAITTGSYQGCYLLDTVFHDQMISSNCKVRIFFLQCRHF